MATEVSEEMRALYEAQRRAHETVLTLQTQVEEEEAVYLEETPHGNIIRGWEGFIDSRQPRKDANPKKLRPYSESEHLFSGCCFYASMASEPDFSQVDIYDSAKDEGASRRKLTVTLSVGKTPSGATDTAVSHHATHTAYRGGNGSKLSSMQKTTKVVTHPATGKGASYQHPSHGKMSKLKKRKREESAGAKTGETAEGTEKITTSVSVTAVAPGTTSAPPPVPHGGH